MGVTWNSYEGNTNYISVNGAWKFMTPGEIIGDEHIPTDTCRGKEQALGALEWLCALRHVLGR